MPQEFIVVRCFECKTFQVHQSKNIPKWVCKMCGEKQSLKKMYGRGTGAECRQLVQSLNLTSGEMEEDFQQRTASRSPNTERFFEERGEVPQAVTRISKWSDFIDDGDDASVSKQEDPEDDEEALTQDDRVITTERPLANRKGGAWSSRKRRRYQEGQDRLHKENKWWHKGSEHSQSDETVVVTSNHYAELADELASAAKTSVWGEERRYPKKEEFEFYYPSQSKKGQRSQGKNKGSSQVATQEQLGNNQREIKLDTCLIGQKLSDKTNLPPGALGRTGNNAMGLRQQERRGTKPQNSESVNEATRATTKSSRWSDFLDEEATDSEEEDLCEDELSLQADLGNWDGAEDLRPHDNVKGIFCIGDELEEDYSWAD